MDPLGFHTGLYRSRSLMQESLIATYPGIKTTSWSVRATVAVQSPRTLSCRPCPAMNAGSSLTILISCSRMISAKVRASKKGKSVYMRERCNGGETESVDSTESNIYLDLEPNNQPRQIRSDTECRGRRDSANMVELARYGGDPWLVKGSISQRVR